ncbi:MAG: hypothetical protein H0T62_12425 [Parachlamydiaceae bacterium]|nr:hypothetical protein [Parachlamydiaceae bacterium]
MQVNENYRNVFPNEPEEVFFSVESEEEATNESVKRYASEAWKQIAPEIKKTLTEVLDKNVDSLALSVTAPCTKAITEKSPATFAVIINPMIETSVKNTSKKVANCAVDKCIDKSEKSIPVVIDSSYTSTQSFLGCISRSSPCNK